MRNLLSGSVLFVEKGKGGDALKKFRKHLKRKAHQIKGVAMDSTFAHTAFLFWCEKSQSFGLSCLKRMTKTIKKHLEGILGYWKHSSLTNARQERFKNKVSWLTRQAYDYRDEEYLHLKIYDLPHLTRKRDL